MKIYNLSKRPLAFKKKIIPSGKFVEIDTLLSERDLLLKAHGIISVDEKPKEERTVKPKKVEEPAPVKKEPPVPIKAPEPIPSLSVVTGVEITDEIVLKPAKRKKSRK